MAAPAETAARRVTPQKVDADAPRTDRFTLLPAFKGIKGVAARETDTATTTSVKDRQDRTNQP